MGLASSQARLLNLTSRMHQIEYKAAKLEAEKLQMANESDRVYNEYLDALEKTKVQHKKLTTDGSVTYVDLNSYAEFNAAGFALVHNNKTYESNFPTYRGDDNNYYKVSPDPRVATSVSVPSSLATTFGITTAGSYYLYINAETGATSYSTTQTVTFTNYTTQVDAGWDRLLQDLNLEDVHSNDFETVLTNIIQSGEVTIVAKDMVNNVFYQPTDQEFHLFETSIATNTNLQEVKDESELRRAEAKYEADMRKIDNKERKYDADLATFDNERNAIKQEMDTLKSVAKENVERTFKIFS